MTKPKERHLVSEQPIERNGLAALGPLPLRPVLHLGFRALLQARRAVTLSERVLAGVTLGLLSGEDLVRMTMATYTRNDRYLGEASVRAGLKGWEEAAVDACFPREGRACAGARGRWRP